ncbi:MAG: hypothetical protein WBE79_06655 [Candidatus Cybelea sp.]
MKLGRWRALVVLAVAFSACLGIYEFLAPRIDLADGDVRPVGRWLSIPGRPTATFFVFSELPRSNLVAAGITVGDRYTPHDSFLARWLWYPHEQIPVTAIHHGFAREVTIVASDRPLRESLIDWIGRIGRIVLRIGMLTLAVVVVWHFADAVWVRWLCAFLVLSGFAPWQVDPLEYFGWWRLVASVSQATATQAAICLAMIFAVNISGRPPGGFRLWIVRAAAPTFVCLEVLIIGTVFDARGAYITPALRLLQLICIVATVVALTTAAAEATGQERQRLRYMAWTFAVGFSGFFFSFAALWAVGNNWATSLQAWSIPRLTLILIPIGLAYGLLSHRVVSSHYIASRTLVYGAITSSLVPVFAGAQWAATNFLGVGKNAFLVALAVIITASFRKIQKSLETFFDRVIFRKQHEVENALDQFARDAAHIDEATTLTHRYVEMLDEHVGSAATALYLRAPAEKTASDGVLAAYVRVAAAGNPSPELIERLDPLVVSLESSGYAIESELLGSGGHAFPMIARAKLVGLLAIGPMRDGEILSPDEVDRVAKLTQAVCVSLEGLRSADLERRLTEVATERDELQRILANVVR